MNHLLHYKKVWVLLLIPFFYGCATYNTKLNAYYNALQNGNFSAAEQQLNSNRFLNASRNELLMLVEKGKLYHLMGKYDTSNIFFNAADKFCEENFKSVGDVAKGALLNPMSQKYLGEPFERLLIHYYKSLNYAALKKPSDALVEARRITLTTNAIKDYHKNERKYNSDAFLYNLQGILYEVNGDINNAFIAYRNAINEYLESNKQFYGTPMPLQLQYDVIRTAKAMGFNSDVQKYEQLFGLQANNISTAKNEAIVFVEQGIAPVKIEAGFTIIRNNNGFFYTDAIGNFINVPFNVSYYNNNTIDVNSLRTIRVALPAYKQQSSFKGNASITYNNNTYKTTLASNINAIATETLQQRMLQEIANAIARQLIKYAIQKGAEAATKEMSRNKGKEKAENAAAVAGLLVNIFNTATEKADTRNWQSLPAFISYVRIPLQEGVQTATVTYAGKTKTINFSKVNGLQLASIRFKL